MSREKQQKFVRWLCIAYASALLVLTGILLRKPDLTLTRESLPTIVTLVFFAVLLSVNREKNWRLELGQLLLLALPLIATIGTNCNFLPHAASNLAAWFTLIMVSAFICADKFKTPYAMAVVPAALALFSATQFFEQYVYCRDDSLWLTEQTATTSKIPLLSGIKLHPDDVQFYENAQKILTGNGFQTGDNILSLYDFPVIVYLMQGVSPGQSWYISWPERDEINAHYFRKANLAKSDRLFLVLGGIDPKKIVEPEMQDALMDPKLGKSFKRIGVLPHPRKKDFKVYFYASR